MSTEFLEHVNSTPRIIGHNKFQLEIETLQKEIEAWKVADAQKDIKLDLFKKTISNLQGQLQEQATRISELQSTLHNNPDSAQVHNLCQLLSDKDNDIHNLRSTSDSTRTKLESCNTQIEELQKVIETKSKISTSLSFEVDALKSTIDQHVRSIKQLESANLTIQQELQMKNNLVDNSQNELECLRQELAIYKVKLNDQVQVILETQGELQKQLEYSKPQEVSGSEDTTPRVSGVTKKKTTRGEPKKRR